MALRDAFFCVENVQNLTPVTTVVKLKFREVERKVQQNNNRSI